MLRKKLLMSHLTDICSCGSCGGADNSTICWIMKASCLWLISSSRLQVYFCPFTSTFKRKLPTPQIHFTERIFYYTYMLKYAHIQIPIITCIHSMCTDNWRCFMGWWYTVGDWAERQERFQNTFRALLRSLEQRYQNSQEQTTHCHLSLNAHACVLHVFVIIKGVCDWISSCGVSSFFSLV